MRRLAAALLLALSFCSSFAANDATRVAHTTNFDIHSDPWINLHHFLYQWSRAEEGIGAGRQEVIVPERFSVAKLSGAERSEWRQALDFYRHTVARLNHFDESMLEQKMALLAVSGDVSATPQEHIRGIVGIMQLAMPLYLKHWWPQHDAGNRRWANDIVADLEQSEDSFVELTERIYNANWSTDAHRVDISAYANFRAGYTAVGHIVIFASDSGNQGLYGLETLYHEVQHTRGIRRPAFEKMEAALGDEEPPLPDNLWHSMIFATAGAFVREYAQNRERPPHRPYWQREQFGEFRDWKEAYALVNRYWLPVISGQSTTERAILEIAEAFEPPG